MVTDQEAGQCGWSVVNGNEEVTRQGEKDGEGPRYTWHHGQMSGCYSKCNGKPLENLKPKSNVILFVVCFKR